MTDKKPSVEELKAAAESAIVAKTKATDARKAADDAGGVDVTLNKAATDADAAAKDAADNAAALSQQAQQGLAPEKVEKMKRKISIIKQELKDAGVDEDEDEDEDDDPADPDAPVTRGELSKQKVRDLLSTISDAAERQAIEQVLNSEVNPALVVSDPAKAFSNAVSIVNRERNAKIIEEANRKSGKTTVRSHGAGAPARADEEVFEPTAEERSYMRPPFNMTEAELKAARAK